MNWILCPKGCGFEGASEAVVDRHLRENHGPQMGAKDGGPAFPRVNVNHAMGNGAQEGMSLRDYFAAAALTGLLARSPQVATGVAAGAYEYADALLAARSKTTEGE